MTGSKNPMSPEAMRDMAVKLIERAAEIELEKRRAANNGDNIVHLDQTIPASEDLPRAEAGYPLHALAAIAKGMYKQRQRRNGLFGLNVTNEPAWDILLDLFVERTAGKRVMTSSACVASNVPPATALRYLKVLERAGLVRCYADPGDARVTYVEISEVAYGKMAEHLHDIYVSFSHARDIARASLAIVN